MSVAGIGALIGSLALASLPNKKRGVLLLSSGLVMGLALVGFASSSSLPLSLGLIVFVGLGQAGRMTLANTLLQYYTEDRYRGRVMSIYMMEFGLTSFGAFGAGLLAEAAGVQWAVGGFAMVLVTLSTLALLFLPRLRKLD
jgi:MFS family permease